MTRPFESQVALVTGAASGIGAACAAAFASGGAEVWCADIDATGVGETVAHIRATGAIAHPLALDVTDESQWENAVATVGNLNLVVHAAGISAGAPIVDMTLVEWRRVTAVNLDGSFLAMKYGVRALRERGGSITAIASASGIKAAPGAAAYSSSKAGVRMLARVVARECQTMGCAVRVNTVSPAGVRTPLWSGMPFFRDMVGQLGSEDAAYAALAAAPGGSRFATPEQIAAAVCYLASDAAAMITGTDLVIDDGYTI